MHSTIRKLILVTVLCGIIGMGLATLGIRPAQAGGYCVHGTTRTTLNTYQENGVTYKIEARYEYKSHTTYAWGGHYHTFTETYYRWRFYVPPVGSGYWVLDYAQSPITSTTQCPS